MSGGTDLINLPISASFDRLVQVSGSDFVIVDGRGNTIGFTCERPVFVNAPFTGSYNSEFEKDLRITGSILVSGSFPFERELMIDSERPEYFKTLTYSASLLVTSSVYDTSAENKLRFDKIFTYDSGVLTQSVTHHHGNGRSLIKTFYYDNNNNLINTLVSEA